MNERWKCWRDPTHPVEDHPTLGWPRCARCGAAPPYHERPDYLPEGLTLDVYVPCESTPITTFIARSSGVVGYAAGERTSIYYEGWVNGAMQYEDRDARGKWEAGVEHAASRLVTEYPTIAQAFVRPDYLHRIGSYDPRTKQLVVDDERTLEQWILG